MEMSISDRNIIYKYMQVINSPEIYKSQLLRCILCTVFEPLFEFAHVTLISMLTY